MVRELLLAGSHQVARLGQHDAHISDVRRDSWRIERGETAVTPVGHSIHQLVAPDRRQVVFAAADGTIAFQPATVDERTARWTSSGTAADVAQ